MNGQINQLAVEISRCFDRILRLIAEEQLCSVIRLQRLENGIAVPVCCDLGIPRGIVQVFVHNRPCAAQAGIETVPVHVMFVFRLNLDAVQPQALLFIQRNLIGIRHQTIKCIQRVHLLRCDYGVLGCIVERTEVRRNRLTGAQLIGCRLEFAPIQAVHIQAVGIKTRDIPVFDAGIQIFDCTSAIPAEGIHATLAAIALIAVPFMCLVTTVQITASDIDQHGFVLDAHRTGIGDGRLQIGYINIDVETRMRRQRYRDSIRNRLRIGLLLAALIGLFHTIGIREALLYLSGRRKRAQNWYAEFDTYRGFLGPVLRISIGDRGRGCGALFIGIAFFDCVFKVVAVFRRHLVAVRTASQIKLIAFLLE